MNSDTKMCHDEEQSSFLVLWYFRW